MHSRTKHLTAEVLSRVLKRCSARIIHESFTPVPAALVAAAHTVPLFPIVFVPDLRYVFALLGSAHTKYMHVLNELGRH